MKTECKKNCLTVFPQSLENELLVECEKEISVMFHVFGVTASVTAFVRHLL